MRAKEKKSDSRRSRIQPIRWTIEHAASEFSINPRTLAGRIKTHSILPGDDGKFSTNQICSAVYDEYERERTRKTKEEADTAALANAETRGRLIDKQDFMKRYEPIWASMRSTILNWQLADRDKDALMSELAKLHTV
jgi:hypothetical protein